jgi:hypothetical protein
MRRFSRAENWTIILKVRECHLWDRHAISDAQWYQEKNDWKLTEGLAEVHDGVVVLEHVDLVNVGEGLDT